MAEWDQRRCLTPPPYEGAMKALTNGLDVGDPVVDALPGSALLCHGQSTESRKLPREVQYYPAPEWCDMASVRRGQALWCKHLARAYFALGQALIVGFSISRFAEVLFHSGYAKSDLTAFERYSQTGFAIIDWFSHPLDDPESRAREQIAKVRLMHGLARRGSKKLFDPAKGEGVPLSQYDIAEVQLGFSGVVFNVFENDLKITVSDSEKKDMVACWRLIGYYLGLQDEFNVCNSVEKMQACFEDYMLHNELRFATARSSTLALQQTAIGGFGLGTGLGSEVWWGILAALQDSRSNDPGNFQLRVESKPGMMYVGKLLFYLMRFDLVNDILSYGLRKQREEWRSRKDLAERKLRVMSFFGGFHDKFSWKLYSLLFRLRKLLVAFVLYRFVQLVRRRARHIAS